MNIADRLSNLSGDVIFHLQTKGLKFAAKNFQVFNQNQILESSFDVVLHGVTNVSIRVVIFEENLVYLCNIFILCLKQVLKFLKI